MVQGTNATGWSELFAGDIIQAGFNAYDVPLLGWTVAILFFVFQSMLYYKTRNATLMWVMGLFFTSLFAVSSFVRITSVQVMFVVLVFELAIILFAWIMK